MLTNSKWGRCPFGLRVILGGIWTPGIALVEEKNLPFRRIVFVCTNQRAEGERVCCAAQGSVELHAQLKDLVKARGLKGRVRVCKAGCMDRCEQGPNVMIFPESTWLSGVHEADLPGVVDRIAQGLVETTP